MADDAPLILTYPGNEALAAHLMRQGGEALEVTMRNFPDGETLVRLESEVSGRDVTIACTLHLPDRHFLPLAMLAHTARDLGARRVTLVAPYLPYMRQDERFHPGEGITSIYFAQLISGSFDRLITVDPHLHRWDDLSQIYTIPTRVVSAAPALAEWVSAHVEAPVVIGPDAESAQWASALGAALDAPHVVFEKVRHGDRDVDVAAAGLAAHAGRRAVILDDIVSTGRTMAATVDILTRHGFDEPVCLGVHAVFSDDASALLAGKRAGPLVTTNTIAHETNDVDVLGHVARAWREMA